MSKKCLINRNLKRQEMAKKYASKRAALKAIINDANSTPEEVFAATLKLAKLPRNSAQVRVHNRCELTGRSHGNYRKLRMSRFQLRKLANEGQIPGMTKSSW